MSWDKASGAIAIYIDGALAHSGTYTAAIGANISSGGTLVFGQEQDSPGGGFDKTQILQGAIGDIRIFNDVRTAQEISDNAFATLSGNEQGLVQNWQVTAASTASVSNVVAGGTSLTVFNGGTVVTTAPVSNTAPDDDLF